MFCPRCGKRNEEGASFCNSCGARLPELGDETPRPGERSSLRERLGRLTGGTRRERLISAGTVVALVIAVIAVIALTGDGSEDEYVQEADRICVQEKQALVTLGEQVSRSGDEPAAARALYRAAAAEIVGEWRDQLGALETTLDRQGAAEELDEALGDAQSELTVVAGAAEEKGGKGGRSDRARLAAAGDRLERVIEASGLDGCTSVPLELGSVQAG